MKILALDLATKTGWAASQSEGQFSAGTWELAKSKEITAWHKSRQARRLDPRVTRLWEKLLASHQRTPFDLIVWEDVIFSSSTFQTMLWASFRTVVWVFASWHKIKTECVPVSTLKKFATGHGGATKDMMSAFLKRQHPDLWKPGYDDNAIDAIWLWLWAKKNLARLDVGLK